MLERLPILYVSLWFAELVALWGIYGSGDMPAASSRLGTALGWGALISMVVMLVYSIARRSKRLRDVARLSYWLHFHIFLGFQGFLFAVFHSLPMLERDHLAVLNPGFLTMCAATVVFCSGVFGRWLFGRLPRGPDGEPLKSQRLFATWILLHRPLAAGMYVLAAMHIALSYMFSPGLGG